MASTPAASAPAQGPEQGPVELAVDISDLTKTFGAVTAVDEVDLQLEPGEFLAVLGPSGCGKTTLLRCLAGFERIDGGRIELAGRPVARPGAHLAAHRRHVAVVPQEGALFPHLSVARNVGFGLGGRVGGGRSGRVAECLEMVGLGGLGERMPHELSGGQQQRVALARALAPRPPLVLLDEPFSALDASLRSGLREDVRQALHESGAAAILVTHDQAEALSMADRVAVMREGRIRQVGTPEELYSEPVDAWVATFVGEAELVELDGMTHTQTLNTPLGPVTLHPVPDERTACTHVVIRPEQVQLRAQGQGDWLPPAPLGAVTAVVRSVSFHGHDALITLDLGSGSMVRARTGAHPPHVGEHVAAWVDGVCRVVPSGDGR